MGPYYPSGVAMDAHGDLFIADKYKNVVEKVSPAGRLSVKLGTANWGADAGPRQPLRPFLPDRVAVDAHGDLFTADLGNNDIEKVTF